MIPRRRPRFYNGELRDILFLLLRRKAGDGKYIEIFERQFAEYIGTRFAIVTCSGRNAMDLLLDSLNLQNGDEILLPAYTLKDLIYIIKQKGLVPKLVDIEKDSFNINPDLIEKEITDRTKVIIATHIFGLPCNIEKILEIAKKYDLKVIEDCAHAAGAKYKGKMAGSWGIGGFFSLETTKPINTFGGGIITTDDPSLYFSIKEKIKSYPICPRKLLAKILSSYIEHLIIMSCLYRLLNLFFMFKASTRIISRLYLSFHSSSRVEYSRFTNLQALIGLRQLADLDRRNTKRNRLAQKLTNALNSIVMPQKSGFDKDRIFYFYVININRTEDLESVRRKFLIKGIDVGIMGEITDNCSILLNHQKRYPAVDNIYKKALQIPIYDELTERKINLIAGTVNKILI